MKILIFSFHLKGPLIKVREKLNNELSSLLILLQYIKGWIENKSVMIPSNI